LLSRALKLGKRTLNAGGKKLKVINLGIALKRKKKEDQIRNRFQLFLSLPLLLIYSVYLAILELNVVIVSIEFFAG